MALRLCTGFLCDMQTGPKGLEQIIDAIKIRMNGKNCDLSP
jgi:hypothetical protein